MKVLKLGRYTTTATLTLAGLLSLFPLYWMLTTALTPNQFTIRTPPDLFPTHPTLDNFVKLLGNTDMILWVVNTLIISGAITVIHLLIDSMSGYAFAKFSFRFKRAAFGVILGTLAVPAQVTLIPLFLLLNNMKLTNSLAGVVVAGLADVFGVFLMRQFMSTIPTELMHAARVDGASEWKIFFSIILPLCKPPLAILALFTFLKHWNDFTLPLVLLRDSSKYTLQIGIASIQGEFNTDYGLLMAAASMAALPMIVLYFCLHRQFLSGGRIGGVKG